MLIHLLGACWWYSIQKTDNTDFRIFITSTIRLEYSTIDPMQLRYGGGHAYYTMRPEKYSPRCFEGSEVSTDKPGFCKSTWQLFRPWADVLLHCVICVSVSCSRTMNFELYWDQFVGFHVYPINLLNSKIGADSSYSMKWYHHRMHRRYRFYFSIGRW